MSAFSVKPKNKLNKFCITHSYQPQSTVYTRIKRTDLTTEY